MIQFLKMHGLGNDFVVFDARNKDFELSPGLARALADRRTGVGCDQLIVIERGANGYDARMRSINADGGEVESCGNASRCVARLLMEELGRPRVTIDTDGGPLVCSDAGAGRVTVDMGAPRFAWQAIPLSEETDTDRFVLEVDGANHTVSAVSIGNPHCVLFVDDAEPPVGDRADAPGRQVDRPRPRVEHDEIVAEPVHLEERNRHAGYMAVRPGQRNERGRTSPACGPPISRTSSEASRLV